MHSGLKLRRICTKQPKRKCYQKYQLAYFRRNKMNNFSGLGRLTKDVDLRYTEQGTAVGNFTLAINRNFKNKQTGEYEADFINCVAFSKTAEIIAEYVKKGQKLAEEGRVKTRNYKNKDDQQVYEKKILVNNFKFVNNAKNNKKKSKQQQ